MNAQPASVWRVFRWPLALTLLTLIGLIAALLGDGVWNVVSWLSLGVLPLAMVLVPGHRTR